MRAILISEPKKFQIIERPIPVPQPDEILIQMMAVSLCNQHDWKVNNGLYKELAYLEYGIPGFPGHEGAGVVVEIGAEVTTLKPGDHVVMSGLGGAPLYQEYVTRKADLVAKANPVIPFEQLAVSELFGCVHRACRKVEKYTGKSVFVSGCGPGGLAAIQIAKAYGAEKIIAADVRDERLKLAAELGADATINAKNHSLISEIQQNGVNIAIECSGNKQAYRDALLTAREDFVVFAFSEGTIELPLWPLFDHELTIHNSKWLTNLDLQQIVDFIGTGKIKTEKMISKRYSFEEYPDAVAAVGRGEIVKAIMLP